MALKDLVSRNRYHRDIHTAKNLQNEASYYISFDETNPYRSEFSRRVLEIYVKNNHKRNRFFNAFAGQILPSVELSETIYSQLSRVWESQDWAREIYMQNPDLENEALEFLAKYNKWWRNKWWNGYQHQFCSFVVVDLPLEQSTFRPEPYPFVLDIENVVYIKFNNAEEVQEIIFKSIEPDAEGKDKLYFYYYTDQFYSKYLIDGDLEVLQFINPHRLGRCPVHKLWTEPLNKNSLILSKGAITPNHDDMFWYNVKVIESRKADMLYLNPTMQSPKISCGFDSSKSKYQGHFKDEYYQNTKCSGGYLIDSDGSPVYIRNSDSRVLCPICGENQLMSGGAGNMIQIDMDTTAVKDGKVRVSDDLIKYITPDPEGTNIQFERIRDLKDMIIKQSVGSDDQPTKSAVNELQQTAIFESKESVLKRISEGISQVRTEVEYDILKLRYADMFISNKYFQGSKFYLYTVEELLERRKNAKDPIQKKQIDHQIIEVKYRNDQKKMNEEKLLYKLLPYNTLTDEEFMENVKDKTILDNDFIILRMRFSDAVELFEADFGPIIDFFNAFSEIFNEKQRLDKIKDMLFNYIKTNQNVQSNIS
jgi:hypothetical protein